MQSAGTVSTRKELSFGFIVGTTSLAFVVSQLDVSIVNIALPVIGKAFGAGISALQWVADAYTIAFAVFMLSAGGMSDLFGANRIFRVGLIIFGIASAGCGLAWGPASLIFFRALQGIGSAMMIPSSLSILNLAFAHNGDQRGRAVAFWTMAGGVSIAAGPVLGGLLLHISSWRMIFLVNIPICLIGLLLSRRLPQTEKQTGRGLDIPGQLAWMVALTAFIAAIIEWHSYGIGSPLISISLALSLLMFGGFLWIERKAKFPILPMDMFRSGVFNTLLILGIVVNLAYYGTVFVLSLYLQEELHYSSVNAGLAFLPLTGGFVISNYISGRLIAKYGIRIPLLLGSILAMVGYAGLFVVGADTPYMILFFPFVTIPLGMGMAVPAMTTGILSSVEKTRAGTASAVLNTTRQAAGAVGVAVFGALASGGSEHIAGAVRTGGLISVCCLLCAILLLYKHVWLNKTLKN